MKMHATACLAQLYYLVTITYLCYLTQRRFWNLAPCTEVFYKTSAVFKYLVFLKLLRRDLLYLNPTECDFLNVSLCYLKSVQLLSYLMFCVSGYLICLV